MTMMIYYTNHTREEIKTVVSYSLQRSRITFDVTNKDRLLCIGAGFDIETSRVEISGKVTGYCYHWQFGLGENVIAGRTLDTMIEFFTMLEDLLDNMDEGDLKILVWDANLGYEYQYCKTYWYRLGLSKLFAKEKRKPLKFQIGEHIIMRECIGLFGHSLAQIASNYCKTQKLKGDLDYDLVRVSETPMTEKEMQYCENDVKILVELGQYVFQNFFGKKKQLPLTSTGLIRNKIKKRIGKNIRKVKKEVQENLPGEKEYNLFRKYLFKGGICGTNALWTNQIIVNVVCADITSDYPSQMLHKKFPMGKCVQCENSEFMSENIPYIAVIKFVDVKSKTTHSFMSRHKCLNKFTMNWDKCQIDNGRVHKADEMIVILNDVEFRTFIMSYDFDKEKSVVLKTWKFERYARLPPYVLEVLKEEYLKKQKLKSEGKQETIEYKDSKSAVNGTSGMMCTAIFTDEWVFSGCEIEEMTGEDGEILKKSFEEATKSMFLSPFWGYWITSYARHLLMHFINKYPKVIVQYDTDSLYFVDGMPQSEMLRKELNAFNERMYEINMEMFGDEHFRDLGAWDIEKPFKKFKGLGSKRYAYQKENGDYKFVVSGCRKYAGVSTIELQWRDTGNVKGSPAKRDILEFFEDGMTVDKDHTHKLASKYIDEPMSGTVAGYSGEIENIYCPSAVILEPVDFTLGMADEYVMLYKFLQRTYNNEPETEMKEIWNELDTLIMTL